MWSSSNQRWEIVHVNTNSVEAFTNKSADLPVGSNPWFFTDGSCTEDNQQWKNLNLHLLVEQPGTFCCEDGSCLSSDMRCDGDRDCEDASDEEGCNMIVLPSFGYKKQMPPRVLGGDPLNVLIETTILNIYDVDETASILKLSLCIELKWKVESGDIKFNFLNTNPRKNAVTIKDQDKIWLPNVNFRSLSKKDDLFETLRNVFVEKLSNPIMFNEEREVYDGHENNFIIETVNKASFICYFDSLKIYPFGIQKCSFKLFIPGIDNNLTRLIPSRLIDVGPVHVGDYQVLKWTFETGFVITETQEKFPSKYQLQNDQGLIYTVHLKRNLWNVLLTTYLPTILMNLINQATNYISSPDKYELIITVNITCMMVLSSIYLAVSTSLPTTAVVKPVEIWLLFSLFFPVLIIMVNILIQVFIFPFQSPA